MKLIQVNEDNFDTEVLQSDRPVIVDFYADWGGPCKMIGPVMEKISSEHPEIKVVKLDVDRYPYLAQQYDVMSIPTIMTFKGGKLYKKKVGFGNEGAILGLLK